MNIGFSSAWNGSKVAGYAIFGNLGHDLVGEQLDLNGGLEVVQAGKA
jgi:hypothetical protein